MKNSFGREINYEDVRHVHSVVVCDQPFHHRYSTHNGFVITFVVFNDFADDAKLWDIVLEIAAEWIKLDHWSGPEGGKGPGLNWCHPQKSISQHLEWRKRGFTLRDLLCKFSDCHTWYGKQMFDRMLEERGIVDWYINHGDTTPSTNGDLVLVPFEGAAE